MDAGLGRTFWSIIFPLLSPMTFFLLVVNMVYAFFDTFGVIYALTGGVGSNLLCSAAEAAQAWDSASTARCLPRSASALRLPISLTSTPLIARR